MNYRVEITAERQLSVCVDFDDVDHEPTEDEIQQALEDLSQGIEMDGYLAEWICAEGGTWTSLIEEYA
jgi:hypothetical protein